MYAEHIPKFSNFQIIINIVGMMRCSDEILSARGQSPGQLSTRVYIIVLYRIPFTWEPMLRVLPVGGMDVWKQE